MRRVFVCSILAEVHAQGPLRSRNFYDDIVSRISGKEGDMEAPLADHGVKIAQALARARLTHNKKKTVVTSSKAHIGKRVVKLMTKRNVTLKVVRGARDLGLDAGGGLRRVTVTQAARSRKALAKLAKTVGLVKSNRVSTRLVQTGAQSTWAYGVEAYGLTAAALASLRSATSRAVSPGGAQNCPVTPFEPR